MTNASCADCGRIVAFRTHDPSEIAECRNCGTWVKRSVEMPGVAVSVKKTGPVARKTPLPPRKDQIDEASANINTRRSATKRTSDSVAGRGETLSAASVYASIRELQKAVYDLQVGHSELKSGQQKLIEGQKILLERTLPVPEMPSPRQSESQTAVRTPIGPSTSPYPVSEVPAGGFYTTRFSSLKIPLIPISLEDLDYTPNYAEEGTAASIPAAERSDLTGLLEGKLPEPPAEESFSNYGGQAFEEKPPAPAQEFAGEATAAQVFEQPAHHSPFTIEGPPEDPFSIAEDAPPMTDEAPAENSPASAFEMAPQPFGGQDYSHEPCELSDPFVPKPGEADEIEATPLESPFAEAPIPAEALTETDIPEQEAKTLSQQIAAAKKEERSAFNPKHSDLLTDPQPSRILPAIVTIAVLGAALLGYLFFYTDVFKPKPDHGASAPPLVEFPAHGIALPNDDERIEEAKEVAAKFLGAKSLPEVQAVISPVEANLLTDFWEPLTAPTIERVFQGRILEGDRVEVDLLVKDFGREERLLPLVKIGEGPFQVDWKSFAECEEVTLLGLAQGTLILDSGEEIDEGAIRSWMQSGHGMEQNVDMGNFQGFRLHNFTEEVVAFAVVRKDSTEFTTLTNALAQTELKHKGKPAIRAVLRVLRIEKEDPVNRKPARLEILEVIATDWDHKTEGNEDELISETLPEEPANLNATEETGETGETENKEGEPSVVVPPGEEERPAELPPVPDEDDPLVNVPGETPIIRVTID